jgi:hypothetical protein
MGPPEANRLPKGPQAEPWFNPVLSPGRKKDGGVPSALLLTLQKDGTRVSAYATLRDDMPYIVGTLA